MRKVRLNYLNLLKKIVVVIISGKLLNGIVEVGVWRDWTSLKSVSVDMIRNNNRTSKNTAQRHQEHW